MESALIPDERLSPNHLFGVDTAPKDAAIVLLPVPFDATASYSRGAARGPTAIRRASAQLDLFDPLLGSPIQSGIALLEPDEDTLVLSDQLGAQVEANRAEESMDPQILADVDGAQERIRQRSFETASFWLQRGKRVGVIGGDHSSPLGLIQGVAAHYGALGVLHIDAHHDLRRSYEGFRQSHASIMHNVLEDACIESLFSVGIRDFSEAEYRAASAHPRVETLYADEINERALTGQSMQPLWHRIIEALPKYVHVSFDIDGLDVGYCPNTGTPVAGGLSFAFVRFLFSALQQSDRKVVSFDLCEVAPSPVSEASLAAQEFDANIGARVLYMLCALACGRP